MMKQYFTISEFAKLRGININSLRYYEKMGILVPEYVNPETKYRYYSSGQLFELDNILFCIGMGIPLKRLKEFYDDDITLKSRQMLEEGQRIARNRIAELKIGLQNIEYSLERQNENRPYEGKEGIYRREIRERRFLIADCTSYYRDQVRMERELSRLFQYGEEKGLRPVFPSGVIFQFENGSVHRYFYFEVLHKRRNRKVVTISQGAFTCRQIRFSGQATMDELQEMAEKNFLRRGNLHVIFEYMVFDKYRFGDYPGEMQGRPGAAAVFT